MSRTFRYAIAILSVLTCLPFAVTGCSAKSSEGFAIYLTKGDVRPANLAVLSNIDISDVPLISGPDIVTYNAQTHELKLTGSAFTRISALEVPVGGRSFVVCVDRQPEYSGAFWTPISSISFDGVTIWKPYSPAGPAVITLELGYPSSFFYGGEDPRNSSRILKSLERAGKLVKSISISDVEALPHAMKGYELYSWVEDTLWHFTLITGTNRSKTLDEISLDENFVSEVGFIRVSVVGVDGINAALAKLPRDESVLWMGSVREPAGEAAVDIQLPPAQIMDAVLESVSNRLDLHVATP